MSNKSQQSKPDSKEGLISELEGIVESFIQAYEDVFVDDWEEHWGEDDRRVREIFKELKNEVE